MQIVIRLDDDTYREIALNNPSYGKDFPLYYAIKNGTPLPKGHGRLIDADDIALIDEQFYVPSDYYVAEGAINNALTIIEADKTESDVPDINDGEMDSNLMNC